MKYWSVRLIQVRTSTMCRVQNTLPPQESEMVAALSPLYNLFGFIIFF